MVFRRRNPLPWYVRLRDILWPRRGWSRLVLYVQHRLGRLPGTPYGIAAGFACGAAVSFTPYLGLHFLIAALLSYLLRANIMASAIGTLVGNPWTFPLIWYWIYLLGQVLSGRDASASLPADLSLSYIFDRPWEILWPMTLGGLPTAVVAWVIAYLIMYRIVAGYQKARRIRRVRKKIRRRKKAKDGEGSETWPSAGSQQSVATAPQAAQEHEAKGVTEEHEPILATRRQH